MENDNEIWLQIVTVKIAAIIKGVSTTKELRKLLPVLFKRRNAIFLLLSKISIFFETLINLGLSQFSLKLKLGRVSVVLRGKQKHFTVLIFTLMKNKFKTVKLFLMMKKQLRHECLPRKFRTSSESLYIERKKRWLLIKYWSCKDKLVTSMFGFIWLIGLIYSFIWFIGRNFAVVFCLLYLPANN